MAKTKDGFEKLIPRIANFLSSGTDAGNIILMLQNAGFDVTFEGYNNSRRSKKDFVHELLVTRYQQGNYDPIVKLSDLLTVREYFRGDYEYKYDEAGAQSLQDKIRRCFKKQPEADKGKRLNAIIFDLLNLHKGLETVSKTLFVDTHYEQAANEACKFLENYIQNKIGTVSLHGIELMSEAFKKDSPILSLYVSPMDSKQKSEQEGFHLLTLGEVLFLKNRLSHKTKGSMVKTRSQCIKVLGFVSMLLETIDNMYSSKEEEEIPF